MAYATTNALSSNVSIRTLSILPLDIRAQVEISSKLTNPNESSAASFKFEWETRGDYVVGTFIGEDYCVTVAGEFTALGNIGKLSAESNINFSRNPTESYKYLYSKANQCVFTKHDSKNIKWSLLSTESLQHGLFSLSTLIRMLYLQEAPVFGRKPLCNHFIWYYPSYNILTVQVCGRSWDRRHLKPNDQGRGQYPQLLKCLNLSNLNIIFVSFFLRSTGVAGHRFRTQGAGSLAAVYLVVYFCFLCSTLILLDITSWMFGSMFEVRSWEDFVC